METLAYRLDIGQLVNKKIRTELFAKGDFVLELETEISGNGAGGKNNALLIQQVYDAVNEQIEKKAIPELVKRYETASDLFKTTKKAELNQALKKLFAESHGDVLVKKAKEVWNAADAEKSDVRWQNIKAGLKLTMKVVLVAASVAGAVVGAATGAGLVLGIYGMVKGAASILSDVRDLGKETVQTAEELTKQAANLKKALIDGTRAANTASVTAREVLNSFTGVGAVDTVRTMKSTIALLRKKLAADKVNNTKAAEPLNDLLDENMKAQSTLEKDVAGLKKVIKLLRDNNDPSGKVMIPQLEKQMAAVETSLDQIAAALDQHLQQIVAMSEAIGKFSKLAERMDTEVDVLEGLFNKKVVDGTKLLVEIANAAAGLITSAATGTAKLADEMHEIGKTLVKTAKGLQEPVGAAAEVGESLKETLDDFRKRQAA